MDAGRPSPFSSQDPQVRQAISQAQAQSATIDPTGASYVSPFAPKPYTQQMPGYAQNALGAMQQQMAGLPNQAQQSQGLPMQQQPQQQNWNPFQQAYQARQTFEQSPVYQNYQSRIKAINDEFQGSPEYQSFQQQQKSFQPQLQQWQQQYQRPFPPMFGGGFGGLDSGTPGIGYGGYDSGYGGYNRGGYGGGYGGGLAALMGMLRGGY